MVFGGECNTAEQKSAWGLRFCKNKGINMEQERDKKKSELTKKQKSNLEQRTQKLKRKEKNRKRENSFKKLQSNKQQ